MTDTTEPYKWRLNEDDDRSNVVVFDSETGKVLHADDRNENFGEILRRLKSRAYGDRFTSLFSLEEQLKDVFSKVSERISVAYGQVFFDGDPIDGVLSDHILRSMEAGTEDFKFLVAFWENIAANPSDSARAAILDWLRSSDFTITVDGLIVGYKGLKSDFTSIHSGPGIVTRFDALEAEQMDGHLPNDVGNILEIPRSDVDANRDAYCSTGLHVGTWEYAKNFAQGAIVAVHVNPRDVVMVPPDCNGQKMRVCRYKVVRQVHNQYGKPVLVDDDWN